MVTRPNDRSLRGRNDIVRSPPAIDASSGVAAFGQAVGQLGGVFLQSALRTLEPIKQAVIEDQTKKGLIAGTTSTSRLPSGEVVPTMPELRQGVSVADRAFNAAVRQATESRFTTSIINRVADLQEEFANNPVGMESAFQGFYGALRENLPVQDRAKFDLIAARNFLPAREKAFERFVEIERDRQTVAVQDSIFALEGEARFHAQDLFSDNPEISQRAADALVSVASQISTGYDAVDMQGTPVFDPDAKLEAIQKFQRETLTVAARAALRRADNPVGFITSLGQRLGAAGVKVSESQLVAIKDQLFSDLNQEMNLENALEAQAEDAFDDFQENNFRSLASNIDTIGRNDVEQLFRDQQISLSQRNTLLAAVENPAQVTDESAFAQLKIAAFENSADFNALFRQLAPGLTPTDRRSIMDARLSFIEDGGFLQLDLVQNARRELRAIYGAGDLLLGLTGQQGVQLAQAMRRFDDAVLSAANPQAAVEAARGVVDSAIAQKSGSASAVPDAQSRGGAGAIVAKPDGTGIDMDRSTRNLEQDLMNPNANLDDLERQLMLLEQNSGAQ